MNTKKIFEVLWWTAERIAAPFNAMTALISGTQKHRDDMLEAFRQHNRTMSLRQDKALERLAESAEYIAKALAVMNQRSAPEPEKKPMRKARS